MTKIKYITGYYTLVVENITFNKLYLTSKQAKEAFETGKFGGVFYKKLSLN